MEPTFSPGEHWSLIYDFLFHSQDLNPGLYGADHYAISTIPAASIPLKGMLEKWSCLREMLALEILRESSSEYLGT